MYEVVRPTGSRADDKVFPAAPLSGGFEGKKIGFMWTLYSNGDILASSLADLLTKRFNGVECVQLPPGKGRAWGEWPDEKSIGQLVKEAEVNAVVVTVGC